MANQQAEGCELACSLKQARKNISQAISFSSLSSVCLMRRAKRIYNNQRCILFVVKLGCLSSQMLIDTLWITFITLMFCRFGCLLSRSCQALLSFNHVPYAGERYGISPRPWCKIKQMIVWLGSIIKYKTRANQLKYTLWTKWEDLLPQLQMHG